MSVKNLLKEVREHFPKAEIKEIERAIDRERKRQSCGGQQFSVHAEGERVILTNSGGRQEIDLLPLCGANDAMPEPVCLQGIVSGLEGFEEPPLPGESPLDDGLDRLSEKPYASSTREVGAS